MQTRKNWIIFCLIIIVNIILYYPLLNAYFVNDDYNWLKPISFYEVLSSFWGGWGHGALFRPFIRLLFYVEFLCFGKAPFGFHIVSIILHSTVLYFIFSISVKLFKNNFAGYLTLLFSLFFFPFHEAVGWISTQTVLLGSVFVVLSLFYYIKFVENYSKNFYYISIICFLFSLLSYESSVILPILCLVTYFIINKINFANLKKCVFSLIPFILLVIIYLIYRKLVLEGLPEANEIAASPIIIFENYAKFLKHQLWLNIPLLVILLISLISFALIKKNKWKYFFFSIIWILAAYLPFSVLGGYTGRFAYFSLFGIMFFIGFTWQNLFERFKKIQIAFIVIILVYFGFNIYKINEYARNWFEAGEIARTIPIQLKELYPSLPDNSVLIFYDIPLGYKQAGVFLTYFEDVIQGEYTNKLNIIHVAHPFNKDFKPEDYQEQKNLYKFKYDLKNKKLITVP